MRCNKLVKFRIPQFQTFTARLKTGSRNFRNGGASLIEIIVYVALLGVISIFVSNALIQIGSAYQRVRTEREVLANARTILDTVTKSIAQAREVYTPTSKFNNDAGQVSLVNVPGAQPSHATAYVDFWADNGLLQTRSEGSAAATISAATVRIIKLRFELIVQSAGREAVKTTLQVDSANPRFPASITLNATAALRGNY